MDQKLENLVVELCAVNKQLWEITYGKVHIGAALVSSSVIRQEINLRGLRAKLINEINLRFNEIVKKDWHYLSDTAVTIYDIIQRAAGISLGWLQKEIRAESVDEFRSLGETVDAASILALKYAAVTVPKHKKYLAEDLKNRAYQMSCILLRDYQNQFTVTLPVIKVF